MGGLGLGTGQKGGFGVGASASEGQHPKREMTEDRSRGSGPA